MSTVSQLQTIADSTVVTPFPAFQGDQLTAYNYINTQLGMTDIRSQYATYGGSFSTLLVTLKGLAPPNGVSPSDWSTVLNQIVAEVTSVSDLATLLTSFRGWYTNVFLSDSINLATIAAESNMSNGDQVVIDILQVLSEVLSVISYMSDESLFNGAADLMACVFGEAANLASGTMTVNSQCASLGNDLNNSFNAALGTLGSVQQAVVADWGKLQQVYALIQNGTLNWPADPSPITTAAENSFEITIWQAFLPVNFFVDYCMSDHASNDANYSDPGCSCVVMLQPGWGQPMNSDDMSFYSSFHVYGLTNDGTHFSMPTTACARLTTIGVSMNDVVNGVGGWSSLQRGSGAVTDDPGCVPKN
jgi:hypothetical protein